MVYTQTRISPGKWDTWNSQGFCDNKKKTDLLTRG